MRYTFIKKIGSGTSGTVWLARDNVSKKEVALKAFKGADRLSAKEFKTLSKLHHPNIVEVYDYGDTHLISEIKCVSPGSSFYTQEYVDGSDILTASKNWDLDKKLSAVAEIANALFYLHTQGVRHGDLKPSNILVTKNGTIKLVDFGAGFITPAYLSPEQKDGRPPDERSDLYALGLVIRELLLAGHPRESGDPLRKLDSRLRGNDKTPITPIVDLILQKLLEKNPDARLQGADEVIELLRRAGVKPPLTLTISPEGRGDKTAIAKFIAETLQAFSDDKKLVSAEFSGCGEVMQAMRQISAEHQVAGRDVWRWDASSNVNITDVVFAHTRAEKIPATEDRWQVYEFCAEKIKKHRSNGVLLLCGSTESAGSFARGFIEYLAKLELKNFVIACVSSSTLSKEEKVRKIEDVRILHRVACQAMNVHDYEGASLFLERELEIRGHTLNPELSVCPRVRDSFYEMFAEALTRSANYSKAYAMLSQCKAESFSIKIKRSMILSQMGRLKEALGILHSIKPNGRHEEAVLKDRQFKLLIKEGRYEDVINEKVKSKDATLQNTIGLAYYYLGKYQDAKKCFEISSKAGGAKRASAKNLLGMIFYNLGNYADAVKKYSEALKLYSALSHPVGRLASMMNLAAVYHTSGEYKNAIKFYKDAVELSKVIGQSMQEANLHNNLANLYVTVNSLCEADTELEIAKKIASARGFKLTEGYNELILADISLAKGDEDAAKKALVSAEKIFEAQKAMREICLVNISFARAEAKNEKAAARYLNNAEELALKHGFSNQLDAISLARGDAEKLIKKNLPKELEWEALALLGDIKKAKDIILWLAGQLPMDMRERYLKEPRREKVLRLTEEKGDDMQISSLKRLLEINKKLTTELSTEKVLTNIMDSVVELTGAERGFLVLKGKKDEFNVPIARNVDAEDIKKPKFKISRSIAERVLRRGEPILTTDALADSRFAAAQSVHAMKLRSVICVPMRHRGETIGVIYIDNRYQAGMFDEDDLEVLTAFADQAAIAYINAKLYEEREASAKKIEELNQKLETIVARQAVEIENISEDLELKQKDLELKYQYKNIIGKSPAMQAIFQALDRITDTDSNVLITGESGTGKELVARAIHFNGLRKERPFVSVNCSAIPSTLLESELFGHKKGSFTGAIADKAGLFEQASGGTIFLDEIGDMPFEMQAKLLRAIQEGEIRRVGSNQHIKVDARVVAATNRDLAALVAEKKFREDLFYRLNVLPVRLPPLRDRREDIPILIDHFLEKYSRGGAKREIDKETMRLLINYQWPGNVRELENEIERAVVLSSGKISSGDLSENIKGVASAKGGQVKGATPNVGIKKMRDNMEREMIIDAIERSGGNKAKAAKLLEISRYGLYKKLERYKID